MSPGGLVNVTTVPCTSRHLRHVPCASCAVYLVRDMSLGQVESLADQGVVPPAARDAYRHLWALMSVRSATYDHWRQLPDDPDARVLVDLLRQLVLAPPVL
jgi:hypothetical protein